MKAKDTFDVLNAIEKEGFDNAFNNSDFAEVKDAEFHKLRSEYKLAYDKLADYLGIVA